MLSLMIKDIRKVLEETLSKFYDFVDYGINPTKVMNDTREFRIEFRIYDANFWMDINTAIDHVYIASQSFGEADNIGTIFIWLEPYRYDKNGFKFGWRTDLESFFDAFHATLLEKAEAVRKAAVDRCNARNDEPNIKIALKEDNLMNYLEEEEAASYEEYVANPPKTKFAQIIEAMHDEDRKSVLSQILDKIEPPVAKVDEAKIGEAVIGGNESEKKASIFNSLKETDDEDEYI